VQALHRLHYLDAGSFDGADSRERQVRGHFQEARFILIFSGQPAAGDRLARDKFEKAEIILQDVPAHDVEERRTERTSARFCRRPIGGFQTNRSSSTVMQIMCKPHNRCSLISPTTTADLRAYEWLVRVVNQNL